MRSFNYNCLTRNNKFRLLFRIAINVNTLVSIQQFTSQQSGHLGILRKYLGTALSRTGYRMINVAHRRGRQGDAGRAEHRQLPLLLRRQRGPATPIDGHKTGASGGLGRFQAQSPKQGRTVHFKFINQTTTKKIQKFFIKIKKKIFFFQLIKLLFKD